MIVDTHSHLNFKAYDKDRDEVINKNQQAGVVCIDVGTKFETSQRAVELAEQNQNIYASIGMHPIHIKTDLLKLKMPARAVGGDENEGGFAPLGEDFDVEKYKKLALSGSRRVVAIGEVGLDYYYKPKGTAKKELFKQKQKEVFTAQLDLAQELNLPVIVHTRMAFADTIEILKNYKLRGVIHCFVGTWQEAQKYLELGFYLGINGVLYKQDIFETIKNCPLDRILTETDCPYLTPPEAGQERNEPIFVKHIIQKIADLRGVAFDQIAEATTQNTKNLFNI